MVDETEYQTDMIDLEERLIELEDGNRKLLEEISNRFSEQFSELKEMLTSLSNRWFPPTSGVQGFGSIPSGEELEQIETQRGPIAAKEHLDLVAHQVFDEMPILFDKGIELLGASPKEFEVLLDDTLDQEASPLSVDEEKDSSNSKAFEVCKAETELQDELQMKIGHVRALCFDPGGGSLKLRGDFLDLRCYDKELTGEEALVLVGCPQDLGTALARKRAWKCAHVELSVKSGLFQAYWSGYGAYQLDCKVETDIRALCFDPGGDALMLGSNSHDGGALSLNQWIVTREKSGLWVTECTDMEKLFMSSLFGLQMDSVTCVAVIAVYAANGQCKEAEDYFSRMKSEGHSPNVYHYSSLLNAFSADGNHIKAGELVSDMKSDGLVPNEVICTPLLKVYARAGLFEKSRQFLSEMDASGYAEDEIPYCLLMDAFSKSGQIDEAMVVFHEMCSHKVKSDGYAYSIMISAFYRGGRLIEAKQLARDYQSMNGLMEGCVEPSMYGIKMFKLTEEMPNNDEGLSQDEKFFFTQRFDDLQAIHGLGTSSIEYLEDEVQKEKKKLILSSLLRQFKRPEIFAFDPGGGLLLPVVSQSLASTRETPLSAQVAIDDFVASITSWQLIFGHYFGKAIMLHNIGSYMLKLSSSKESKTSLIELIRWVWKASSESETETELKFSYLGVDWHEARSLIFDPGGYLAEDWLISHYNLKCCYCLNLVGQINEIFEVFWPHVPENYASRMVKVTRGVLNASIRKFVFDPGGGALLLIGKSLKLELVASLKDLQSTEIEITEGSAIGELLESFGMKGKLISGSLGDTILAMQKYSRQYKNILNFDPEREGARLEDHVIYLSVRDEFAYMSEIALSRGMWLMQTEVERSFLIWILLPCFTLLARTSRWSMAISLALTRKLLVIYQRVLQLGKRKVNVNLQDGLMGAASMVIKLEDFAEIKAHSLLLEVAEELVVFGKKFLKSYVAISLTGLLEARSLDWLRTTSTTSHHRYISCRILFFYELVIDDP